MRALAENVEIPKSTLHDHLKVGEELECEINFIKPALMPANEISCLVYDLSKINTLTIHNDPEFLGFYNEIHIDEKWFELTEIVQRFIKVKGEPSPHLTVRASQRNLYPSLCFCLQLLDHISELQPEEAVLTEYRGLLKSSLRL